MSNYLWRWFKRLLLSSLLFTIPVFVAAPYLEEFTATLLLIIIVTLSAAITELTTQREV